MRACIQRVKRCSVSVEDKLISSTGPGMLVLLGIRNGDSKLDGEYLAERCASLRVFDDAAGKMNLSIEDVKGEVMVVSQFTLYGDTRKGNRPNYTDAAASHLAEPLYDHFIDSFRKLLGDKRVVAGVFRAMMEVDLVNDGPVTVIIDSKNKTANE
jgi:D-tyrosyl-tRNA(Tyr) deacylase